MLEKLASGWTGLPPRTRFVLGIGARLMLLALIACGPSR